MKKIKYMIVVAVLGLTSTASAQNLNSGYFADGFLYRHELNPAIANDQGYVALPGAGNINIGVNSNLRVDEVLYNVTTASGKKRTALFLHPQVDAQEFMQNIHVKNRISENLKLQVLGFGFRAWGGYNTFAINARENLYLNIPGSLFDLAKNGLENKTYDISNLNAHADAYAEIAFGHSRQFGEKLRLGAKLKVLLGVANADLSVNKAQLQLTDNAIIGVTDAKLQGSLKELKFKNETKTRGNEGTGAAHPTSDHTYVSGVDDTKWGIAGAGVAVDLGAEYKIDDNWKVSAALLDLGFIRWNKNYVASTNGEHEVNTSIDRDGNNRVFKLKTDDKDTDPGSMKNQMKELTEDLAYLYELQDNGEQGGRTKLIGATMNLGVEYKAAFYEKLSFGALNSTRLAGKYSWTDFRFSANWAPTNAFSASANVAIGTYGTSFGWLLNVHPTGFNLFLGMDHLCAKLAKQGVPLSGRTQVSLGINFPFGKAK